MEGDRASLAFQAHLAEFAALRQEMLELIKWRDRLVFLSFGISGALFSFALSGDYDDVSMISPRLSLYLVSPLASAIGGLWMVNTLRIHRIGAYIRDVIARNINIILNAGVSLSAQGCEVFTWEGSSQRLFHKWFRRFLESVVLLAAFVVAGAVAQVLIVRLKVHGGPPAMVTLFRANWILLFLTFLMLLRHLVSGRSYKACISVTQALVAWCPRLLPCLSLSTQAGAPFLCGAKGGLLDIGSSGDPVI